LQPGEFKIKGKKGIMVFLLTEAYHRKYSERVFSSSTLCCVFIYAIVIVIPFFIVFATNGFWITARVEYEQPTVQYRYEFLLYNYNDGQSYGFSNIADVSKMMSANILDVTSKTGMIDTNSDGKYDIFDGYFAFRGSSSTLKNTQLYIFFDYAFTETTKLAMQDFVRLDISSSNGISQAHLVGDISLRQLKPFPATTIPIYTYNYSLFSSP